MARWKGQWKGPYICNPFGSSRASGVCCTLINSSGWWLSHPSEKYESQLGWFFPIYGKIKNVPNRQPVLIHRLYFHFCLALGTWETQFLVFASEWTAATGNALPLRNEILRQSFTWWRNCRSFTLSKHWISWKLINMPRLPAHAASAWHQNIQRVWRVAGFQRLRLRKTLTVCQSCICNSALFLSSNMFSPMFPASILMPIFTRVNRSATLCSPCTRNKSFPRQKRKKQLCARRKTALGTVGCTSFL